MSITAIDDAVTLNNGVQMPWLGLGTFRSSNEEVVPAIEWALEMGYRHIDTAAVYGNEEGVGKVMANAGIAREHIFLTTKLWNGDQREDNQRQAFEQSLERLGTDYIDLYLIHWPVAGKFVESWKIMTELHREGRIRAIGVSNFLTNHLDELLPTAEVTPAVNQVEFHPYLVQPKLLEYCQQKQIVVEAWSPIMKGQCNDVPELQAIAGKYGKTPAQVVLRWDVQHGVVTIPKSVHRNRIEENCDIFDFELSDEDMAAIDALDRHERLGADPNKFSF